MESHARTIAKAISWRCIATATTMIVVWLVTGKLELAAAIGMLDTVLKLGEYYVHERIWARIRFGMPRPSTSEYEI